MRLASVGRMLFLASLASCNRVPSRVADDQASIRAQLAQFHLEFDSLYRRADAQGIAARLTDSVVVSPIEGPDLSGRETVRGILAAFFDANAVAQYSLELTELDVSDSSAFGRGTFVWASGPRGAVAQERRGRFAAVYRRGADGIWRLHRLLENLLPAPAQ